METTQPKQRKQSVSYGIRAFRQYIETFHDNKMLSDEDYQTLCEIFDEMLKTWTKNEFGG